MKLQSNIESQKRSHLAPIGSFRAFEISAKVETSSGLLTKVEKVDAKVIKYIGSGSELSEGYSLNFNQGGYFSFYNQEGGELIVRNNEIPVGLFKFGFFPGGILKYSDGTQLSVPGDLDGVLKGSNHDNVPNLWTKNALDKYGFRIIRYELRELKTPGLNRIIR
ncbi:hypothetical protein JIN85_17910 [Luteolibacter pohnpeiensis]|uniref:Uncharacterized protein n=1 Tax=Luteolibacter pohnpeiensis TaxID=454153 RepID=A0A934VXF2_9BACT|nr:hypothetical protein [Luteolibacter pohnpeiensis]MBK1884300.1 hypothetical protein [Luteolibacter pohnpeiensis]